MCNRLMLAQIVQEPTILTIFKELIFKSYHSNDELSS